MGRELKQKEGRMFIYAASSFWVLPGSGHFCRCHFRQNKNLPVLMVLTFSGWLDINNNKFKTTSVRRSLNERYTVLREGIFPLGSNMWARPEALVGVN
jgi:hypothetical protein